MFVPPSFCGEFHSSLLWCNGSFGLATLYQLKGRVGRGNQQAFAYFLLGSYQGLQGDAESRLKAIQSFQDLGSGRKIAEADMGIRGAGSMYGTNQSGMNDWIGPGLTNRYAELQSVLLASRTILPGKQDCSASVPAFAVASSILPML